MSAMNFEVLYDFLNENKNKIKSNFDLMMIVTCWYFNSREYEYIKEDKVKIHDFQKKSLISFFK